MTSTSARVSDFHSPHPEGQFSDARESSGEEFVKLCCLVSCVYVYIGKSCRVLFLHLFILFFVFFSKLCRNRHEESYQTFFEGKLVSNKLMSI